MYHFWHLILALTPLILALTFLETGRASPTLSISAAMLSIVAGSAFQKTNYLNSGHLFLATYLAHHESHISRPPSRPFHLK